jgi:methylthioribose-1-phosphate isomerase
MAAEARRVAARAPDVLDAALAAAADRLAVARPTAVNLAWAVRRMSGVARRDEALPADERVVRLEQEAGRIAEEDRRACEEIGRLGAAWLAGRLARQETTVVLTHCNAGALATAGIGTALGVIRALAAERRVAVFADETRPFLQGARLTAWELQRDGLDVTVLPDVAAAGLIRTGRVAAVVVGADRIARNGDVANKVGTYGVALACHASDVPFVVAAPTTTLDPECLSGDAIPIEVRTSDEVLQIGPVRLAPAGVHALYPAFDVTPADLVDAIVTERGVSVRPHEEGLRRLLS